MLAVATAHGRGKIFDHLPVSRFDMAPKPSRAMRLILARLINKSALFFPNGIFTPATP
jgi:hypothetical protein